MTRLYFSVGHLRLRVLMMLFAFVAAVYGMAAGITTR